MTKYERWLEQCEDNYFALLMEEVAKSEGERAIQENQALLSDPDAAIPDDVFRRCQSVINKSFSRQRARSATRRIRKVFSKIAIVALIGILLTSVAFAAFPAFRTNTLNLLIEVFGDRTAFLYGSSPTVDMTEKVLSLTVDWLPEGYGLAEYDADRKQVVAIYRTSDGREIEVSAYEASGGAFVVDTENADVNSIFINDKSAMTISKDGLNRITIGDVQSAVILDISSKHEGLDVLVQVAAQTNFN